MSSTCEQPPEARLRLLILEDDSILARSWVDVLGVTPRDVRIAGTLAEAHRVLSEWDWLDGALLDYRLPDGCGDQLLEGLRSREPPPGLVFVTGHGSNALRIAVHPILVLEKPLGSAELHLLAETVLGRRDPLQQALLGFARLHRLSSRHRQLLLCAIRGLSHAETAVELDCSVGTVKKQWQRIFERVGIHGICAGSDPHAQQRVVAAVLRFVAQQRRQC